MPARTGKSAGLSAPGSAFDMLVPFLTALPITGAFISVSDASGRQSSLCSSDPVAARLDELQFELGEGPQREATRTGAVVLIDDVAESSHARWPVFGMALRELDVAALFAIPLVLGAVTVGAVGLYRSIPGSLTDQELATATAAASAIASVAVRHALAAAGEHGAPESSAAPAMRREIHQATGMIVVQLETTATIAYSRLFAHAFGSERSVHDVAHDVVSRQLNFETLPE
ncbi:hypothetical protein BHD05_11920 [Marisediminicola antarctica]|uniref:ANTAR domain-containing protein n=2 Tax=Marisediminicola antarctica TaxID=674079 RepID=A0A7L5ALC0_9MICO|nr:hypothetical protein BHD05_11920 [Marisediminicola antarctica]